MEDKNFFNLFNKKKVRFVKRTLSKVTQQMLSKQLKELEQDGLVNREVKSVMPPKVEYSLTSLSLIPILKSLSNWNNKNSRNINLNLNKNFEKNQKNVFFVEKNFA